MTTASQPGGAFGRLDLAAGALLGWDPRLPLPKAEPGSTERTVLEAMLLPLFAEGPVGVPLLTGSSSAILLAVAAALARREGYELPVPLSLKLTGPQTQEEVAYQERVVRHLGLEQRWERVDAERDLEMVGPEATAVITTHGVQYPPNIHWIRPLVRRLGGGTLVVAHGRAEGFDWWYYGPLWQALRSRSRPSRQALLLAALALMPPELRPYAMRLRRPAELPWLTQDAQRAYRRAIAEVQPPVRYRLAIPRLRSQRCFVEIPRSYARIASDFGVKVLFPWLTPELAAASLQYCTNYGYADGEGGQRFFGDLFPADFPVRRDRVAYGRLYFGEQTRAFARSWSGRGLDEELVDPAVLRELWMSERYHALSSALLQTAWLHDQR